MTKNSSTRQFISTYGVGVYTKIVPISFYVNHETIDYMNELLEIAPNMYDCNRLPGASGALLVTRLFVIIAGVGPPKNSPSCKDVGCEMENKHCVRCIHAERRCIANAARYGIETDSSILYSVYKPCYECTKQIIEAGIKAVYFSDIAYDEERTRTIMHNSSVSCIKVKEGEHYPSYEVT